MWRLDLDEGIDFAIYLLGGFERQTQRHYARLVKPGDIALDIGANIGAHSLPLARLVGPQGQVYAFEPTDFAYRKLISNMTLNPDLAACVTAAQIMLAAHADDCLDAALDASWPVAATADSHALYGGRAMSTEGAAAQTLDDYLAARNVERVDFIKLDVDGNELRVLQGGRETLRRFRPVLVTELAPDTFTEQGFEEFIALLREAGYRLLRKPGGGALPLDATALAARIPRGASINAWALPP